MCRSCLIVKKTKQTCVWCDGLSLEQKTQIWSSTFCSYALTEELLTPSCRRYTSRHFAAAAAPPSSWWQESGKRKMRMQRSWGCPPWSARNCRCWRSSGRSPGDPGTPRRAGPWSPSSNFLMMSETGHHPRHLHLCAATTVSVLQNLNIAVLQQWHFICVVASRWTILMVSHSTS